jgi:hypothetical protein
MAVFDCYDSLWHFVSDRHFAFDNTLLFFLQVQARYRKRERVMNMTDVDDVENFILIPKEGLCAVDDRQSYFSISGACSVVNMICNLVASVKHGPSGILAPCTKLSRPPSFYRLGIKMRPRDVKYQGHARFRA